MPKFVGCKRSGFYVVEVFEVFEGHEAGKVNLNHEQKRSHLADL